MTGEQSNLELGNASKPVRGFRLLKDITAYPGILMHEGQYLLSNFNLPIFRPLFFELPHNIVFWILEHGVNRNGVAGRRYEVAGSVVSRIPRAPGIRQN